MPVLTFNLVNGSELERIGKSVERFLLVDDYPSEWRSSGKFNFERDSPAG